ncbi:NAD-dependent epimerase/dehydratase family protein [Leptospira levettii]|uniref:NAD-dependent epimerase/dehydratase family protein n=1 Tax=Leptospira levettii TaxID=2023178 RepID=A0AAW5VGA0_9LEPT|nr:NAD-dependent epimerase/dehydratase family protein [Leptospira levettii]MCW7466222.1 NAD-dependent epimerase/dehydratase family protein [Leptospira levettii]MCW7512253.1 NAD-dependent epimerase/dehydratase family protein [Leptospira levettii]MCW7516261.1 NAD-dependent epimerase/dehydratase family protein [Leptospira levettii]
MAKLKLLVVGGTGFIGSHLVREGLKRGLDSYSLSLSKSKNTISGVTYLQADIRNNESVVNAIGSIKFDYVIHCGGYINHVNYSNGGDNVIQEHLTSLYSIVKALDKTNMKRFLLLGSSDEYGAAEAPQNENIRELPISPYSFAKVAGAHFLQMLFRTEKFPGTIARLFLTYGPGQDDKRFLPQIIKGCLENKEFPTSSGEQYRDFCYIDDTVEGLFKILESTVVSGEIINISSGVKVTIREMIEKVVGLVGSGKPKFGEIPYRVGENMALYADVNKAYELIGWKASVSLDDGLKRTIEFYQNQKP